MNNYQMLDIIERANDEQPICSCGKHTRPVWRDGAVWLDCASLGDPPEGRLGRAWAAVTAHLHTHERIVDVAPSRPDTVRVGS
jgi:hypothetical protein